jgi:N-acetylglucosamine-6-phosphate deacetylase
MRLTAIDAGLNHFTHAFSAMRGLHHREPGVVGALMYYQETFAEVATERYHLATGGL